VTSETEVARLAATATERFGRLDIAFANAGIGAGALIVDADLEQWKTIVDVCLVGPFLTIKHSAPRMTAGSSIVITTSLNAVQPGRAMSAYCAAKAGAAMLAQVAALELGSAGIRVNAVAPGLVRTALTDGMWQMGETLVGEYLDNTPPRLLRVAGRHRQRGRVPRVRRSALRHRSAAPGRRGRGNQALSRRLAAACRGALTSTAV
jgi:NAD(P)-dependent dehydrogenase (short-subunit alcohol dehydrogenase family)